MQQWVCRPRLPAGPSEKVGHAHLVSEHQVRDDIARESAIAVGIKQTLDGYAVAPVACFDAGDVITHVRRGTRASRDEPAAEAPTECVALIDGARQAESLRLVGTRRAEHQKAGYPERVAGHVATQTFECALELR